MQGVCSQSSHMGLVSPFLRVVVSSLTFFLFLFSLLPSPKGTFHSPLAFSPESGFLSLLTSFWLLKLLFLLGLCAVALCIPDEHVFPGTLLHTPSTEVGLKVF